MFTSAATKLTGTRDSYPNPEPVPSAGRPQLDHPHGLSLAHSSATIAHRGVPGSRKGCAFYVIKSVWRKELHT
jgi:hypothetical protein